MRGHVHTALHLHCHNRQMQGCLTLPWSAFGCKQVHCCSTWSIHWLAQISTSLLPRDMKAFAALSLSALCTACLTEAFKGHFTTSVPHFPPPGCRCCCRLSKLWLCTQIRIFTPKGDEGLFDFAIISTGLLTDARLRPELAALADHIRTWDSVQLPAGQSRNPLIDAHPYLGPGFEFQEKVRRP